MSKKDQELVKLALSEEIYVEIMELDDLVLDSVIGGVNAVESNNKCPTNAKSCTSNTGCGTDPVEVD